MAHFYGTVSGNGRTKASRTGTKKTEIKTTAASWDGAIEVKIFWDSINEVNKYQITQIPWKGAGKYSLIKEGIFEKSLLQQIKQEEKTDPMGIWK
tara:strand:+ start:905 stop:1189 length:285 start_codon:yes stop_codon:yes gene_type:complete